MKEADFLEKMIAEMQARLAHLERQKNNTSKKQVNPKFKTTIILDAGHGGMSPEGKYVTAPSKMWMHPKGAFHEGKTFFEGVFNRIIVQKLIQRLEQEGIPHFEVAHSWKDTPLHSRCWKANELNRQLIQQGKKSVYFSIHGNASENTSARGWLVFVSKKASNDSKKLATFLAKQTKLLSPIVKVKQERPDCLFWRANYKVLSSTAMPAILSENLFFTNYEDTLLMMSKEYQNQCVEAHLQTALFAQDL